MPRAQQPSQSQGPLPKQTFSDTYTVHGGEQVDRLIDIDEVSRQVGLSTKSVTARVKANQFPTPVRFSSRCVRWSEREIQVWVQQQLERRTA